MDLGLSYQIIILLFAVAAFAGCIDAIAGGGGLITIPALLWAGIPPTQALATNKLQACGGSFFASWYFIRQGIVSVKQMKLAITCAFIGAALGTIAVQLIDIRILETILPFLILTIGGYFLFSKKLSDDDKHQVLTPTAFAFTAALAVGLYDGFFGPGTGSFFALAGISLRGYGIIKSTAIAKTLNFSTNIASLIIFLFAGKIVWTIGVVMMFGQVIGAWLGSHCLFSINPKLLRMLVVIMCFGMLIKYSYDMGWLLAR